MTSKQLVVLAKYLAIYIFGLFLVSQLILSDARHSADNKTAAEDNSSGVLSPLFWSLL